MKHLLIIKIILIVLVFAFLSACASSSKPPDIVYLDVDMVMPPAGTAELPPEQISAIIDKVETRNRVVEDDEEWIQRAYSGLLVRKLINVSEAEYPKYKKYLDNGSAYIIIHPAFFPFFHFPKKVRNNRSEVLDPLNIVEFLLKKRPNTSQFAVLQAQERRTRDFLEFKSTQKKLVIVVVPRDYQRYSGYTYRRGKDEYMRYLNEVTNLSESVLFVESRSPNRGYLTEEDAMRLMEFLISVDAKTIYVGGGYIGRCLEDFYAMLTKEYGREGIYVVPELSDISPREMTSAIARKLLKSDGKIDEVVATKFMKEDKYNVQETIPAMVNLP